MEQYILTKDDKPESWRCWDTSTGFVCKFQDKKFKETQQTIIADSSLFLRVQNKPIQIFFTDVFSEMVSWLIVNHIEKLK